MDADSKFTIENQSFGNSNVISHNTLSEQNIEDSGDDS